MNDYLSGTVRAETREGLFIAADKEAQRYFGDQGRFKVVIRRVDLREDNYDRDYSAHQGYEADFVAQLIGG